MGWTYGAAIEFFDNGEEKVCLGTKVQSEVIDSRHSEARRWRRSLLRKTYT